MIEERTLEQIEEEQKEEIKQAIKERRLYDYIACNYWRIEDNLLVELLEETIATLEENQSEQLIENLEEYKEW